MLDEFLNALTDDRPVGWIEGRPITGQRMRSWVEAVASTLARDQPAGCDHAAFAFARDRAGFTAALLGAWRAGFGATIPADARREFVAPSLSSRGTGILLHDTGVGRGIDVTATMERAPLDGLAFASVGVRPSPSTVLRTVGSAACRSRFDEPLPGIAGRPNLTLCGWSEEALRAEIDHLARDFDWPHAGATVSTLAPSSLPSVLLGVLMPIVRGASFASAVPRTGDEVARVVRACRARVLVSAPAHLRALLELPIGALCELECVVSSWAELDPGLGEELTARHGVRVFEALTLVSDGRSSSRARALERDLSSTPGVEDCAVVESAAGLAAVVQAPTLDLLAIERSIGASNARVVRVDRVPRDPNGGVAGSDVWRNFGCDATGAPLALDIGFDMHTKESITITIPAESAWFDGHFHGAPVLAGAVQLQEIVLPAMRRLLARDLVAVRWSALKFAARILPGDTLHFTCRPASDESSAKFEIRRDGDVCTTGALTFASDPFAGDVRSGTEH